jgi:uncharacterized Zn finger protein
LRENAATKARRLLTEGRVTIVHADEGGVAALVRGDTAMTYRVTHAGGEWRCDCPARTRCSHVQALMLVTLPVGRAGIADVTGGVQREPGSGGVDA